MTAVHPFRFGVQASTAPGRDDWVALARRVEAEGFSTFTMPDHFNDQLAPVPALMAVADATTTLRVGALVWDNDYRHPVVLTKEMATIDVLSGGRLEIGLGAGWMRSDYEQTGMRYDPPGVRVSRFLEGLELMQRLFADGPCTFEGEHYTVRHLEGHPKPLQQPSPPLLIGGGGPRILRIAATRADIVGINANLAAGSIGPEVLATLTAASVDEKVGWVRDAAGDRNVELNIRVFFVAVTDDRNGTAAAIANGLGMPADEVLESPFALIGTTTEIADTLRARRERWGFSYIVVGAGDVEPFAPVVAELAGT